MKLHASEITGSLSISGSIIPDGSGSWDLGSATNPWKDLHIVSSSLKMYGSEGEVARLQLGANNELEFFDVSGLSIANREAYTPAQIRQYATRKDFRGARMGKADSVIRVGITNVNELDTSGGNLLLDSAGGTVDIDDNLAVAGIFTGTDILGTGTLTFGSLSDGTITITDFKDQDDMSSNSATSLSTQQSIKAYVDSQVTAQDLDFQGDSGGTLAIDLDSESLTIAGGTNATTVGSGNGVTINVDDAFLINSGNDTTSGTITAAGFIGDITGDVTGNTSGTAATVTTAAQPNITSLGTLTGLTGGTGDFNWDSNTLVVDSSENAVGIGTTSFRSIAGLNPQRLNIEGVNGQWDSG